MKTYIRQLTEEELNALDPGIRSTVKILREWGFETTDSGDGVTKIGNPDALPFPHVFMVVHPFYLIDECCRLANRLYAKGINIFKQTEDTNKPRIEGSYNPADGTAVIMLTGVVL